MNTSAKGASYENRFKRHLLDSRRAYEVTRAAGSHGTYDLISVEADAVCGYQLKSGRMSCQMAIALSRLLDRHTRIELAGDQPRWRPNLLGRAVENFKVTLA